MYEIQFAMYGESWLIKGGSITMKESSAQIIEKKQFCMLNGYAIRLFSIADLVEGNFTAFARLIVGN